MFKPDKSSILLKFKRNRYVAAVFKADNIDTNTIEIKLLNAGAEVTGEVSLSDTYYDVPEGILKLREVQGASDVALMYYTTNDACEAEKGICQVFTLSPPGYLKHVLQELLVIKAVVNKIGKKFILDDIHILLADVESRCSSVELELRISLDSQQKGYSLLRLRKLGELLGFSVSG